MSRVVRTPILLLCNRFLMHCEGQILVWDVYTLLFLIWWERIVSTRGYIDRRNDNALVFGLS